MTDLTPTIEEQIQTTISDSMGKHQEAMIKVVETTIGVKVNGKIEDFRKAQDKVNEAQLEVNKHQNEALENILKQTKDVIEFYNGSFSFFRSTKLVAGWITAVSAAGVALWAFIKFVVMSAK